MSRHDQSDDEDAAFLSLDTDTPTITPDLLKPEPITLDSLQSTSAKKKAKRYEQKELQKGVCYLGRVPPKITPHRIREALSQFGELGRIYLQRESEEATNLRKKITRGSAAARYDCGWVEFLDKRRAKRTALMLQGQPMRLTMKTRTHGDDLWQIEYLSKVKWDDLRQQSLHKKLIKSTLMTQHREVAQKEIGKYLQQVDRGKKRERKQMMKQHKGGDDDSEHSGDDEHESNDAITPADHKQRQQRSGNDDNKDVGSSQSSHQAKKQKVVRKSQVIDKETLVKLGHRSL